MNFIDTAEKIVEAAVPVLAYAVVGSTVALVTRNRAIGAIAGLTALSYFSNTLAEKKSAKQCQWVVDQLTPTQQQ